MTTLLKDHATKPYKKVRAASKVYGSEVVVKALSSFL
jgi:hypothetical protein